MTRRSHLVVLTAVLVVIGLVLTWTSLTLPVMSNPTLRAMIDIVGSIAIQGAIVAVFLGLDLIMVFISWVAVFSAALWLTSLVTEEQPSRHDPRSTNRTLHSAPRSL